MENNSENCVTDSITFTQFQQKCVEWKNKPIKMHVYKFMYDKKLFKKACADLKKGLIKNFSGTILNELDNLRVYELF